MSLDIYLQITVDIGKIVDDKLEERNKSITLYENNITHNVVLMWKLAGCYDVLYNKDDQLAIDILPILEKAISSMKGQPAEFEKLNPANGWGNFKVALTFLIELYEACLEYPKATVISYQ